jgi:hypothetical protein
VPAKKRTKPGRGGPLSAKAPIQASVAGRDLFGFRFHASRRVEEILEQIQELRSAGKVPQARALLKHAEGIRKGLRALEAEVRTATLKRKQGES